MNDTNDTNFVPRIALCGFILESNAFSPITTEADFRGHYYYEDQAITGQARAALSDIPREMASFVQTMDATGEWEPVPLILTGFAPWGPVEQGFFERTIAAMVEKLRAADPVDGIYIANHGAMVATGSPDPDGTMVKLLRQAAGDSACLVMTLDLHANLSDDMVESTDVIVGYQTNPHVDMIERGEEAAHIMRAMLAGLKPKSTFIRLPLAPPSVTLLTREGPYADLIDYGQRRKREMAGAILNVSVFGNFTFSDTPMNGISVVVAARHDEAEARALCREIAQRGWHNREAFRRELTSIDEGVALAQENAKDSSRPALIYSDAGDNPGGGGGGNTMWLLQALVRAEAKGVLYGSFFDRPLAEEAHRIGVGNRFEAVFNRDGETEFAKRFAVKAEVLALTDGVATGRRGIYAGRALTMGPCAALQIGGAGGVIAIIISTRYQTADPIFFEQFGLRIEDARTVCVKSRGHFRAGFDLWFEPDQVLEIDTAGLTSPILSRFDWKGLPRPVYPLDEDADWVPPNW